MSSVSKQESSSYFVSLADCSRHTIFNGVDIATMSGETMMISIVTFAPKAKVLAHKHEHEQMGMLLEGELTFTIGGETRTLHAGEMWRIPGGIEHSAVAGEAPVRAIDIFHPIREDYR